MKVLVVCISAIIFSTSAYSQVAKTFLDGIESRTPFKNTKDTTQLYAFIVQEATQKGGQLNFWEHFDEKSMNGYQLEDSIYESSRGIPSYLWGKALAILGINDLTTVLALYRRARGYDTNWLFKQYIEAGFKKGKEKSGTCK